MKKFISLLVASAFAVSLLAGCGSSGSAAPAASGTSAASTEAASSDSSAPAVLDTTGGTTVIEQETTEDTKYADSLTIIQDNTQVTVLDPHNATSSTSSAYTTFNFLYDRLVTHVGDEYLPELATSWETEDLQNYTFHLRDDVTFSNGEPFTADDVAFTLDRAKNEGMGTKAYNEWGFVDSYEIVDDHTIKMTLTGVNVDFVKMLADPYMGILNREAVEADPEKGTWVTTGAFTVREFVSNEYGIYDRNENYWSDPPITKTITMKFVAEETARLIALQKDEADVVAGINTTEFPAIEKDPNYQVISHVDNNPVYLVFNTNDPICADINFRKAVISAINRDDVIAAGRNGYAVAPTNGSMWGYKTEYMNEDTELLPYDPDAAKEFLAQSSYNGETVEIAAAIPDVVNGATVMQQQLQQIGINVEIYQTDPPGMTAYTAWGDNKSQMVTYPGGWDNIASTCRSWYMPGNNYNRASLDIPEVNEILDKALATADDAEREALYKEAQRLVAETFAWDIMYYTRIQECTQKGVGGVAVSNMSAHDYTYAYRIIEG